MFSVLLGSYMFEHCMGEQGPWANPFFPVSLHAYGGAACASSGLCPMYQATRLWKPHTCCPHHYCCRRPAADGGCCLSCGGGEWPAADPGRNEGQAGRPPEGKVPFNSCFLFPKVPFLDPAQNLKQVGRFADVALPSRMIPTFFLSYSLPFASCKDASQAGAHTDNTPTFCGGRKNSHTPDLVVASVEKRV